MARPATNNRMPDKKIRPGSRATCSANSGKEAKFSTIAAAIATSVGPIRPAIVFDVVMAKPKRALCKAVHAEKSGSKLHQPH
jgi:hypothetical protein